MNTMFELRNQIFSLIYEKLGKVHEQHEIEVPDGDGGRRVEIVDEYNQFGELLYKSDKNYVLVSSKAFEYDDLYDPYNLVDDCFIKSPSDSYIGIELMDAIYPYLTWGKDIVLSIYQYYDSGVGFCFIRDEEFIRSFEKIDGEKIVEMINEYIDKSVQNSDHKQGYAYARINDGKYEEYEYMPFFFDEEEWPPNGYD